MRRGNELCAVWAVAFATPDGAARLLRTWTTAIGAGSKGAATQQDGSRYVVRQSGAVAVLLENVPDDRIADLVSTAAAAFR